MRDESLNEWIERALLTDLEEEAGGAVTVPESAEVRHYHPATGPKPGGGVGRRPRPRSSRSVSEAVVENPGERHGGALGVSQRTLERWRSGESHPQRAARLRLAGLLVLVRWLENTFAGGGAEEWFRTDNRYLGRMKPSEAIWAGRVDRVETALEALDSNIFL